jgi:vacuolar iron transporter family protein
MAEHREGHRAERVGWLRAAVLGANDGIVSTASLLTGVAAAEADRATILLAGAAGLVAGAMSMASGEFVSVSSQADSERADLDRERRELAEDYEAEVSELQQIYIGRGLEPGLAQEVARQLMARDALAVHAREELGIIELTAARPLQAAVAYAAAFAAGAAQPLLVSALAPRPWVPWAVSLSSLLSLALLGGVSAKIGGSPAGRAVVRVTFWGAAAMLLTAAVGKLIGVAV